MESALSRPKSLAVVAGLCLMSAVVLEGAELGYQDWQFGSDENPATPTVVSNSVGVATAAIEVGYVSAGWLGDLLGFGSQTGLWDLGLQNPNDASHDTRGRVRLTIPSPVESGAESNTELGVRLVQFVDGTLYTGDLAFSLPGALFVGRTNVEVSPGPFGGAWVADTYQWQFAPSPTEISLTVTGAVNGTILDRIETWTSSTAVQAADLVITGIEKKGDTLAMWWSGGRPPYQVFTSTNPVASDGWQLVGSAVTVTNVEISVLGSVRFYRVRGTN